MPHCTQPKPVLSGWPHGAARSRSPQRIQHRVQLRVNPSSTLPCQFEIVQNILKTVSAQKASCSSVHFLAEGGHENETKDAAIDSARQNGKYWAGTRQVSDCQTQAPNI